MTFAMKYTVVPAYLTAPSKRRPGRPIMPAVKFVVVHDTGNPRSTARNNVDYYERSRNEISASAHLFVDDREILECIPALTGQPEKAWHVLYNKPKDNELFGYDANDAAIGIEYCYGGAIDADEAYRKYVWVTAYTCHQFGLDPRTSIVGHFILDPGRKTDPQTGLAASRRSYEQLLRDIADEYASSSGLGAGLPPLVNGVVFPKTMKTIVAANLRRGLPSRRAPVHQVLSPGTVIQAAGVTDQGEPVNGNPVWYHDANMNYVWSGGVA
jgi:N-acetylmuramoyl-L-alanine amidase